MPFVVACGLHSTGAASSSEGGIVIDLRKMRNVTVNTDSKTITAQGGCIWENVDVEAAKYGLATVGGEFTNQSPTVHISLPLPQVQ